nr:hypothetical protein ZK54.1 - Caenorhabditis elegans [Caenorhabditis elegans]
MKAETLPLRPLSNGTTEAIDGIVLNFENKNLKYIFRYWNKFNSKRWKRRHLVAVLAMFGFAFIYGTQITLSNTFMEDEQKVNKTKIPVKFIGQAVFLFLVTTTSNSILLVTLFSISSGFGGICWSGFLVNHLDLAPQYAGHLIALSHTLATIPAIFGPSLIKAIVKHGTIDEWNVIMYGDDEALESKRWKRRHVVAILALLGFANIYAMRANLSIAIVEMTSGTERKVNGTTLHVLGDFENWTPMTQGVVLSSFFYGYIVSQLPGGYLAYTHGAKTIFFAGTFGTAVFTLLTPPFARMGYGMLVFARFMEGLLEGVTYPAMHVIWSRWAPPMEQTKLATFAFSGSYFGTVVAMPLSAYLGEHFGWPMIFWFFGKILKKIS